MSEWTDEYDQGKPSIEELQAEIDKLIYELNIAVEMAEEYQKENPNAGKMVTIKAWKALIAKHRGK